jgi:hypothetical protein
MTDPSDTGVDLGPEERRLVVEAIATLAHLKQNMIDMLLRPASVPPSCYAPFLNRRDERTGHLLSKRQVAPLIIAEIEKLDEGRVILRRIIRRAAEWDSFHLAGDDEMEAREASLREAAREAQVRRIQNSR